MLIPGRREHIVHQRELSLRYRLVHFVHQPPRYTSPECRTRLYRKMIGRYMTYAQSDHPAQRLFEDAAAEALDAEYKVARQIVVARTAQPLDGGHGLRRRMAAVISSGDEQSHSTDAVSISRCNRCGAQSDGVPPPKYIVRIRGSPPR